VTLTKWIGIKPADIDYLVERPTLDVHQAADLRRAAADGDPGSIEVLRRRAAAEYSKEVVMCSTAHRVWIRDWMRAHVEEHRDGRTGEVNHTALVDAWDRDCAGGEVTLDHDHPAWDIAIGVGDARVAS
jgi:hypothetical protein